MLNLLEITCTGWTSPNIDTTKIDWSQCRKSHCCFRSGLELIQLQPGHTCAVVVARWNKCQPQSSGGWLTFHTTQGTIGGFSRWFMCTNRATIGAAISCKVKIGIASSCNVVKWLVKAASEMSPRRRHFVSIFSWNQRAWVFVLTFFKVIWGRRTFVEMVSDRHKSPQHQQKACEYRSVSWCRRIWIFWVILNLLGSRIMWERKNCQVWIFGFVRAKFSHFWG